MLSVESYAIIYSIGEKSLKSIKNRKTNQKGQDQ